LEATSIGINLKYKKPPKESCRLVAREAHGTHGCQEFMLGVPMGVVSYLLSLSCKCHQHKFKTKEKKQKNKGISSDEPKSKSPNLQIPIRNA
jgi:hypothetical protein